MYAIVKTGGKQYKVAPGDIIEVEKLDAAEGDHVDLEVICIVDGDKVEADPAKASATKVSAVVLEQFKGDKQLVFKFKKRKNYKRTKGHRQQLTRIQIEVVGSQKAEVKKPAKADDQAADAKSAKAEAKAEAKATEAKAQEAVEAVEETAEEAVEAVEEATEAADDAVEAAEEAAEEAVEEAADAAEGDE